MAISNITKYSFFHKTLGIILILLIYYIWMKFPSPIFILAISFVPIIVYLILKYPFFVCLSFIIFSFFRIHEAFPQLYSLHIPQMLAIASMLVLVWHMFITKNIKVFWVDDFAYLLAFFLIVTVGVLFSSNRELAVIAWSGNFLKIVVMVIVIAWFTRTPKNFSLAIHAIVLAGIAIAFVALINKANGIGLVEGTRVTISRDIGSVLGDPNDLSLVLLFPISFCLALVFSVRPKVYNQAIGIFGFCIILAAIIATQSRGGLLGVVAVAGTFLYTRIRSKSLFIGISLVGVSLLFIFAGISDRSSGGASESGVDESAMGRLYAWEAAFFMALKHPFLGVGIDNFFSNYFFYSPHWDGKNHAVHSTWFGVLAETGFLGFSIFFLLLIKTLKNILLSGRLIAANNAFNSYDMQGVSVMSKALLAGFFGFVVSGTFLTQGFTWPIYIIFALSIATLRFTRS